MAAILTHAELEGLLGYWQQHLNLKEWTLSVQLTRGRDMLDEAGNARQGQVCISLAKRIASIDILAECDFEERIIGAQDMEVSLVHELLEIHLSPITRGLNKEQENSKEFAIECLSHSLVVFRREQRQRITVDE